MSNEASANPSDDIVVVGAGHAGREAALAARAFCRSRRLTFDLDRLGYVPSKPSRRRPGTNALAAESDTVAGELGRAAGLGALRLDRLNPSKGPAIQTVRPPADRHLDSRTVEESLETQLDPDRRRDDAVGLRPEQVSRGRPWASSAVVRAPAKIGPRAVVAPAGRFLSLGYAVAGEALTPAAWGPVREARRVAGLFLARESAR